jgi:hypothetical protein
MTPLWVWVTVLITVVLLHGAASGARVAAGRDGRLEHRRTEGRGALRGMAVASALVAPFAAVTVIDATMTARTDAYAQAAQVLAYAYGPIAAFIAIAFVAARTTPWQVRVFIDSVVVGAVEFTRPLIAGIGVVAVAVVTRDATVTVLAAVIVTMALQATRLLRHWWYPPLNPAARWRPVSALQPGLSSAGERQAG